MLLNIQRLQIKLKPNGRGMNLISQQLYLPVHFLNLIRYFRRVRTISSQRVAAVEDRRVLKEPLWLHQQPPAR